MFGYLECHIAGPDLERTINMYVMLCLYIKLKTVTVNFPEKASVNTYHYYCLVQDTPLSILTYFAI